MKLSALILLLFSSTVFASGTDPYDTNWVSNSRRWIEPSNLSSLSCEEHAQSDGSKIVTAALKLNGLGVLNESVTLAVYNIQTCDGFDVMAQQPIQLIFSLYNLVPIDEPGDAYPACTVQGVLSNGLVLSAWYWNLSDTSACL